MTRGFSKTIAAGAIATLVLVSGSTHTVFAGDGPRRHDRDFSVSLNLGGYGGGFDRGFVGGYGENGGRCGGGYRGGYGFYSGSSYGYPVPFRPISHPSCCHIERVFVPGHFTPCGTYVPGYVKLIRVCDVHGRVVLGTY